MGDFLEKGVTFQSGSQLTHTDLNNLVDNAVIKNQAIGYAQLKNGSIAESIFGYPVVGDENTNDLDYILIWSQENNDFRKITKKDLANAMGDQIQAWFSDFFATEQGTRLTSLTEPVNDVLVYEGNHFIVQAKYENQSGRIEFNARIQAADGVFLYNSWFLESEYSGNKFTIEPDQDNLGGDPQVDIRAELKARANFILEANNGNLWTIEASDTNNDLNLASSETNSGGDPRVQIQGDLNVVGDIVGKNILIDEITKSDGSKVGGATSYFNMVDSTVHFGVATEAYIYKSSDKSLRLTTGAAGTADWLESGTTLNIQTIS